MESASFQPQPPQQLRASKSWLGGLGGAVLQPPQGGGEVCEDRGEAVGMVWQVHSCLSITPGPCKGIFSPSVSPVIQPRPRVCSGTSPPVLFSAPRGARAPPYPPREQSCRSSHHPAPGCSCRLAFLGAPSQRALGRPQGQRGPGRAVPGIAAVNPGTEPG